MLSRHQAYLLETQPKGEWDPFKERAPQPAHGDGALSPRDLWFIIVVRPVTTANGLQALMEHDVSHKRFPGQGTWKIVGSVLINAGRQGRRPDERR